MSDINFAGVLKRMEVDASTGSLVCVGDDSMFGRIYFVGGKPSAARCRHLEGKAALDELDGAELTSTKFYDKVDLIKAGKDDADIGAYQAGDAEPAPADAGVVEVQAEPEIDALVDDSGAKDGSKISDAERAILVEELTEYVGPVADMVVSGLGDDIDLSNALKLLAGEIGDAAMARQFVGKVKARI